MRHDRDVPSLSCYCGFNLRREAAPHATQQEALQDGGEPVSFNLRREAAPHATTLGGSWYCPLCRFQSQTRSRSTCDDRAYPGTDRAFPCFNLRREAAPHATLVPICLPRLYQHCFNLRREAAPHATCRYLTG